MLEHVQLLRGDITTASVDAIVNAANPAMLGGGGVDGAIHRAAGPELLAACRALPVTAGVRCPIGDARITPAGRLRSRFVIHAVGPVYRHQAQASSLLASAYRSALHLALAHRCHRVAMPAISCGIYGYPLGEAAEVALAVCASPCFYGLQIHFYLIEDEVFSVWSRVLAGLIDGEDDADAGSHRSR